MQRFGTGSFGILVEWKTTGEKTIYRYEKESTRDAKLKSFKSNKKVKSADKATF